jgi:hypothetical protein
MAHKFLLFKINIIVERGEFCHLLLPWLARFCASVLIFSRCPHFGVLSHNLHIDFLFSVTHVIFLSEPLVPQAQEGKLLYCATLYGLVEDMTQQHDSSERFMSIDSSKLNLEAVLLRNTNKYTSVPTAHAVHTKKSCDNMAAVWNIHYDT